MIAGRQLVDLMIHQLLLNGSSWKDHHPAVWRVARHQGFWSFDCDLLTTNSSQQDLYHPCQTGLFKDSFPNKPRGPTHLHLVTNYHSALPLSPLTQQRSVMMDVWPYCLAPGAARLGWSSYNGMLHARRASMTFTADPVQEASASPALSDHIRFAVARQSG